ncbi:MAG: DUF4270 family protein, partial [Saprospiraceae bacterium]
MRLFVQKGTAILTLFVGLLIWQSCGDTIDLGSELLQNDELAIGFTDTLSFSTSTVRTDSVQTFYYNQNDANGAITPRVYPVGQMTDPIFGRSTAEFYIQFNIKDASPDFVGGILDSAVFSMAYDTLGIYGDISAPFSIELHELAETLDTTRSYYSNKKVVYDPSPVASLNSFIAAPRDSVTIIDSVGGILDTIIQRPHVRLHLDQGFASEIFNAGTDVLSSNAKFTAFFKGLAVVPTSENSGILAFNPVWVEASNSVSKMTFYYHDDGVAKQFNFYALPTTPRSSYYTKDYSSSVIATYINDPGLSQELVFVQGLSGLQAELTLPDVSSFGNSGILNYAELEFAIAELPGDLPASYPPVRQLVVSEKQADGTLKLIDDYRFGLSAGTLTYFGGTPIEGELNGVTYKRYRMNLSSHI